MCDSTSHRNSPIYPFQLSNKCQVSKGIISLEIVTVFHATPDGRFIEISANFEEGNATERIKGPVFLEIGLAPGTI